MVNIKEEAKKFIIDSVGNFLKNKKPPDTFQPLQLIFPEERYTRSYIWRFRNFFGYETVGIFSQALSKKKSI